MNWLPFVYQYTIQALVFALGMVLAVKSGQLNIKQRRGKLYLLWMLLTFFIYFSVQGFMQFLLPLI